MEFVLLHFFRLLGKKYNKNINNYNLQKRVRRFLFFFVNSISVDEFYSPCWKRLMIEMMKEQMQYLRNVKLNWAQWVLSKWHFAAAAGKD